MKETVLVVGVGPATGQALCRQLAGQYTLALVARSNRLIGELASELPDTHAFVCDIADRDAWAATLKRIRERVGLPRRIVLNTESATWGAYHELPLDRFSQSFDVNAVGFLQLVQTLFPDPEKIPSDTRILISSSPAAYAPPAAFLGLAPSRVAQRVMAELLNELLAGRGLRFSVFSIDGAIDTARMRAMLPDRPQSYFLSPDDVAREMIDVLEAADFAPQTGITGESSFANR